MKEREVTKEYYLVSTNGYLIGPFNKYSKAILHVEEEGLVEDDKIYLQGLELYTHLTHDGSTRLPKVLLKEVVV